MEPALSLPLIPLALLTGLALAEPTVLVREGLPLRPLQLDRHCAATMARPSLAPGLLSPVLPCVDLPPFPELPALHWVPLPSPESLLPGALSSVVASFGSSLRPGSGAWEAGLPSLRSHYRDRYGRSLQGQLLTEAQTSMQLGSLADALRFGTWR